MRSHILIIQRKMHKFIQILAKFLNISNHFLIFLKRNFFLLTKCLYLILSKDQFGICWKQYTLCFIRDQSNQETVSLKINLNISSNRVEMRVLKRENKDISKKMERIISQTNILSSLTIMVHHQF